MFFSFPKTLPLLISEENLGKSSFPVQFWLAFDEDQDESLASASFVVLVTLHSELDGPCFAVEIRPRAVREGTEGMNSRLLLAGRAHEVLSFISTFPDTSREFGSFEFEGRNDRSCDFDIAKELALLDFLAALTISAPGFFEDEDQDEFLGSSSTPTIRVPLES